MNIGTGISRILPLVGTTHKLPKSRNKGFIGHYIEECIGLPKSSRDLDFIDGELKTIRLILRRGSYKAKETIKISMISLESLHPDFYQSACYKKLRRILIVTVIYNDILEELTILGAYLFKFDDHIELREQIKTDYDNIRDITLNSEIHSRYGGCIQSRTAGPKNSNTRAFYFRRPMVDLILSLASKLLSLQIE